MQISFLTYSWLNKQTKTMGKLQKIVHPFEKVVFFFRIHFILWFDKLKKNIQMIFSSHIIDSS